MIKEHKLFYVVCDICGIVLALWGDELWYTEQEANLVASESGWIDEDNKTGHVCENCQLRKK